MYLKKFNFQKWLKQKFAPPLAPTFAPALAPPTDPFVWATWSSDQALAPKIPPE